MKFSSCLALGTLIGSSLMKKHCRSTYGSSYEEKTTWKDMLAMGILIKNEGLDKDGIVRKMVSNGTTDSELEETQESLDNELERKEERHCIEEIPDLPPRKSKEEEDAEDEERARMYFDMILGK